MQPALSNWQLDNPNFLDIPHWEWDGVVMAATLIDLFAGCGGLSLGLSNAGFSPQFAVEAHDDAFETYSSNLIEGTELEENWPSWLEKRAWHAEHILDQYPDCPPSAPMAQN